MNLLENKLCLGKCRLLLTIENFNKDKSSIDGFSRICKKCRSEDRKIYYTKHKDRLCRQAKEQRENKKEHFKNVYRKYRENNLNKKLLKEARYRAKKKNLDFNLKLTDIIIPNICPILQIPLFIGKNKIHDNSPTIDRIDNFQGYIKENIQVISWKANRIKNNASLEDLEKLIFYMKNVKNKN